MIETLPWQFAEPFSTSEARSYGLSTRRIASSIERGEVVRIAQGWYCIPPTRGLGSAHMHRLRAEVALRDAPPQAVLSHESAALLHGLPLVQVPFPPVPHLTVPRISGGRRSPGRVIHSSPDGTANTVFLDGLPVTSIPRTVADLARTRGFVPGVCAADAALAGRMTTKEELVFEGERHRNRTGAAVLRKVVGFSNALAESPGESYSRCVIHRFPEIPEPRLQHEFFDPDGHFVARTDFDWDGRIIGEFDGRSKYGRLASAGQDPGEVVWAEKQREDRLRALGMIVVRWTWADLEEATRLRNRLRAAFQQLDRTHQ